MNTFMTIGTCATVISTMTVLFACFALNVIILDMSISLTLEAENVTGVYLLWNFCLPFLLIRFMVLFGLSFPFEVLPF
jgi:hypothetical protein